MCVLISPLALSGERRGTRMRAGRGCQVSHACQLHGRAGWMQHQKGEDRHCSRECASVSCFSRCPARLLVRCVENGGKCGANVDATWLAHFTPQNSCVSYMPGELSPQYLCYVHMQLLMCSRFAAEGGRVLLKLWSTDQKLL